MKFNSVAALIRFLGVLGNMGYLVPFYDYNAELKNKGFIKHIHFYSFELLIDNDKNLTLMTRDNGKLFEIFIQKGLV